MQYFQSDYCDIAELCDAEFSNFISVEWRMRALEWGTEKLPSALLQKCRLKINIAAYGGAAGVLVDLGLQQPEVLHLKQDHQLKANKISYISMHVW